MCVLVVASKLICATHFCNGILIAADGDFQGMGESSMGFWRCNVPKRLINATKIWLPTPQLPQLKYLSFNPWKNARPGRSLFSSTSLCKSRCTKISRASAASTSSDKLSFSCTCACRHSGIISSALEKCAKTLMAPWNSCKFNGNLSGNELKC